MEICFDKYFPCLPYFHVEMPTFCQAAVAHFDTVDVQTNLSCSTKVTLQTLVITAKYMGMMTFLYSNTTTEFFMIMLVC